MRQRQTDRCWGRQINLDDAWLAPTRDRMGRIRGDPGRFPNGIKYVADKLHAQGLKLGL